MPIHIASAINLGKSLVENSSDPFPKLTLYLNYDYRESSLELIYPVNYAAIADSKVSIEDILTEF